MTVELPGKDAFDEERAVKAEPLPDLTPEANKAPPAPEPAPVPEGLQQIVDAVVPKRDYQSELDQAQNTSEFLTDQTVPDAFPDDAFSDPTISKIHRHFADTQQAESNEVSRLDTDRQMAPLRRDMAERDAQKTVGKLNSVAERAGRIKDMEERTAAETAKTIGSHAWPALKKGWKQFEQSYSVWGLVAADRALKGLENVQDEESATDPEAALLAQNSEEVEVMRRQLLQSQRDHLVRIVDAMKTGQEIKLPPEMEAYMAAETLPEKLELLKKYPTTILSLGFLVNAANFIPAMGAGMMGLGPLGVWAGSGGHMASLKVIDALQKRGVNVMDLEQLQKATANEALMDEVWNEAEVYGTIVGGFDALSYGVASKMLVSKGLMPNRIVAREAANQIAQVPVQATLGGLGELAGSQAAHGDFSWAEVFDEFIFEAPGALIEAPFARRNAYQRLESDFNKQALALEEQFKLPPPDVEHEGAVGEAAETPQEGEVVADPDIASQDAKMEELHAKAAAEGLIEVEPTAEVEAATPEQPVDVPTDATALDATPTEEQTPTAPQEEMQLAQAEPQAEPQEAVQAAPAAEAQPVEQPAPEAVAPAEAAPAPVETSPQPSASVTEGMQASPKERIKATMKKDEASRVEWSKFSSQARKDGELDLAGIDVQVNYTDEAGQSQTVTVKADRAMKHVEQRQKGLAQLVRCLG